jgi:hypothetical protein
MSQIVRPRIRTMMVGFVTNEISEEQNWKKTALVIPSLLSSVSQFMSLRVGLLANFTRQIQIPLSQQTFMYGVMAFALAREFGSLGCKSFSWLDHEKIGIVGENAE